MNQNLQRQNGEISNNLEDKYSGRPLIGEKETFTQLLDK